MGSTIIEQDFPYDLRHRGKSDQQRHNKRVDEAARKQLKDIISQQDIITSEGNRKIKIKLKYLDQYRFIHNKDRHDQVGRDEFDELSDGEIISRPAQGEGPGRKAGQGNGEALYEAEYTIEQLTEMMMEDLELPDLDDTKKNEIVSDVLEWTDRRKQTGIHALLDKRKTLHANILRRAKLGQPSADPLPIIPDDLRFKTWQINEEKHSNAVIFLMMDRSGSMYDNKIYAVKALYFWIVQFLRRRYDKVEIKFIAHDYAAREMEEKDFFSISEDGGTLVSSAYALCRDIIKHNYPRSEWNIYCFHASDGDSWGDEDICAKIITEILDLGATLFGYSEIDMDSYRDGPSTLLEKLSALMKKRDGVLVSTISENSDILDVLKIFLRHSIRTEHGK